MRKLTNAETLEALKDPWSWCIEEIKRRNLTSKELGLAVDCPRSTLRQLYSGHVHYPNHPLLVKIINYLLETRSAKVSVVNEINPGVMPVARAQ